MSCINSCHYLVWYKHIFLLGFIRLACLELWWVNWMASHSVYLEELCQAFDSIEEDTFSCLDLVLVILLFHFSLRGHIVQPMKSPLFIHQVLHTPRMFCFAFPFLVWHPPHAILIHTSLHFMSRLWVCPCYKKPLDDTHGTRVVYISPYRKKK